MADVATLSPFVDAPVRRRWNTDKLIKTFFGSNALIAIVVLGLITIFLFREGFGFFGQNLRSIRLYRRAGLEYVDIMREATNAHAALARELNNIRQIAQGEESPATVAGLEQFDNAFSDSADDLNALVSDAGDQAVALRDMLASQTGDRDQVSEKDESTSATAPLDEKTTVQALLARTETFRTTTDALRDLRSLLAKAPKFPHTKTRTAFARWEKNVEIYSAALPETTAKLRAWNRDAPVPAYRAVTSFLFGCDWITASFWQDWYGIIPLLVGSIMVSIVALAVAVPFGVAAAIYVSEVARPAEKRLIKPYVEFIAAIPSVVFGFFGIAVVGESIRQLSQSHWFHWVSFFPIAERLNVFTAGLLLALMAVPTIFTLSEDALRNVPRGFVEASYALGANRLQTIGARARSSIAFGNRLSRSSWPRSRHRRNDGCAAVRGQSHRHPRFHARFGRIFSTGSHHDRHHRAGDGRSGARKHSLSRALHGGLGSFRHHPTDQLRRSAFGSSLPDVDWMIALNPNLNPAHKSHFRL